MFARLWQEYGPRYTKRGLQAAPTQLILRHMVAALLQIEDEIQVLEVANPTWDSLLEQLATAVRESGGACISVSLAAPAADETEVTCTDAQWAAAFAS